MAQRIASNGTHRPLSRTGVVRARRRAAGRRSLPPHMLPGVARRRSNAGKVIGAVAALAVAGVLFFTVTLVMTIAAVATGALHW